MHACESVTETETERVHKNAPISVLDKKNAMKEIMRMEVMRVNLDLPL